MKYLLIVPDGLTEDPWGSEKTPLEVAHTPFLDDLAGRGIFGFVRTIPQGFHPGSEIGNMVLLGYDPSRYFTGRGPIEAASKGLKLKDDDIVFRCNLVTLYPSISGVYMLDYSAGHISDEEASEIIDTLNKYMSTEDRYFVKGKSYRNLMVWGKKRPKSVERAELPAPHDIVGKNTVDLLKDKEILKVLTESQLILKDHPVNKRRREKGEREANSIWLWGQGRMPKFKKIKDLYGIDGAVISAVDLVKGLGVLAGLEVIEVEGATGYIDTNYEGKAEAALDALKRKDFVYVHIEAPDEAGHSGDFDLKKKVIEDFDRRFLGRLMKGLSEFSDWRLLLLPDHPTPISLKTHSSQPVPFVLVDGRDQRKSEALFSERRKSSNFISDGTRLIKMLFEGCSIED